MLEKTNLSAAHPGPHCSLGQLAPWKSRQEKLWIPQILTPYWQNSAPVAQKHNLCARYPPPKHCWAGVLNPCHRLAQLCSTAHRQLTKTHPGKGAQPFVGFKATPSLQSVIKHFPAWGRQCSTSLGGFLSETGVPKTPLVSWLYFLYIITSPSHKSISFLLVLVHQTAGMAV